MLQSTWKLPTISKVSSLVQQLFALVNDPTRASIEVLSYQLRFEGDDQLLIIVQGIARLTIDFVDFVYYFRCSQRDDERGIIGI